MERHQTQKIPGGTYAALSPALPFTVGGERLFLRPLVLRELPAAERVMEGWRMLVATGGQVMNAEAWEDFLALLASSVGKPLGWLEALEEADFEKVVCLVMATNEDIWKPKDVPEAGDDIPWAEILQSLIEHGHDFETLQGYTLAQAKAFLLQGFKREREDLAQGIQAAAFAMADGKTVQKAVKELRRV